MTIVTKQPSSFTLVPAFLVKLLFAFILFSTVLGAQSERQTDFASVHGTVVDQEGQPVAGAQVYAWTDGKTPPGPNRTVKSDAQGHFSLDKVYPGRAVALRAYRDTDLYGSIATKFQDPSDSPHNEINVEAGQTLDHVVVRIPRKSANLEVISLDASTKAPLPQVKYQLCRGDHAGDMGYCATGASEGDFHHLVPPDPISIKITVANYAQWTYRDVTTGSPYLTLKPDETRKLIVYLDRVDANSR